MNFTIDQTNLMIAGTRGDSGILNFNFIEDMRGYSAIFTVKKFADDSDDEALVTKYFDFPPLSSSATEAEMKTMTVYLNPEDTLGIVLDSDVSIKYNDYVWGLKINRGPVFSKTVIPLGAATFPKFRVYYGITDDWGNTSPYFNPDESSITVDIGLAVYGTQEQPVQTSFSIDATNLMITGTRGDSGLLSFIFSDDMRGYSVLFCIKKYQEDSDSDAILTKSFDFPSLSSDATDIEKTVMTLSFIPEDTVSLDLNVEESVKYNDYVWGMKIFRGPVFSKTLIPSNGISFPKFRLFYGINKTWGNASPYYTGESSDINVDVTNVSYYITKPDLDFAIEQHNQFHYSHPFILSGLADLSASILSGGDNLSAHIYDFNNPHQVTKTQIGLGSVENISITGAISTHNLNLSAHDDIRDYITTHIYDTNNPHLVSKEQVGLGNVENLSVSGSISAHNLSVSAHTDIREYISSHIYDKIESDERYYIGNLDSFGTPYDTTVPMVKSSVTIQRETDLGVSHPHGSLIIDGKLFFTGGLLSNGLVRFNSLDDFSDKDSVFFDGHASIPAISYNDTTGKIYGCSVFSKNVIEIDPITLEWNVLGEVTGLTTLQFNLSLTTYGDYVYVGDINKIHKFSIVTKNYEGYISIPTPNNIVHALNVSPDGQYLIGTSLGYGGNFGYFLRVTLYDEYVETIDLTDYHMQIPTDDMSFDNQFAFVAGEAPGTSFLKIDYVYMYVPVEIKNAPRSYFNTMSPDGKMVYYGSLDGTMSTYNVELDEAGSSYIGMNPGSNELLIVGNRFFYSTYSSSALIGELTLGRKVYPLDMGLYLKTETDPLSIHLDQTTPQTFTLGDVTGTGILKVTSGTLGLDTTSYAQTSSLSTKADLVNGIVPLDQLPNITITDTFVVSTSSNLTTLSAANQGDIGIVTDISKTFILTQNPASTLGNWVMLATPTDSVISVNNKIGVVTLSASDIPGSITTGDITGEISIHNLNLSAHSNQFSSLSSHLNNYNNPHQVTKSQIGLGNVENISITGSINTHNTNLSAHLDIRYDWYLDGSAIKRYDDSTFSLTVSTISITDKTLAITSWSGSPIDIKIKTDSIKDGWSVTEITDYAFSADEGNTPCSTLVSIHCDDVKTIGVLSFFNCDALTSINFPEVLIIKSRSFRSCNGLVDVYIPKASILYDGAFRQCSSLSTVSIPSVSSIGNEGFWSCTSLENVEIPQATTIGLACFQGTAVTNIYIPNVTYISDSAFAYCASLSSISIASAAILGDAPFMACNSLSSIYMPNVSTIGWGLLYQSSVSACDITLTVPQQVVGIDEWGLPPASKIKVPYEYLSNWKTLYPALLINNTWSIEAYSDSDSSSRINAHNTSTDSHSDMREEIGKCLSTTVLSGYDSSKQYAFSPNTDGTIKAGSLSEIIIPTVSFDNTTLTPNLSGSIQAIGVIDGTGLLVSGSDIRSAITIIWDI